MNDGFRGVGIEAGKSYVFSVVARRVGNGPSALRVEVVGGLQTVYVTARVEGIGPAWERHSVTLVPTQTQASGRLAVFLDGPGAMDVDVVSLFPSETYKNRPGGLRKDLGDMLEALHPGFLRFPGGCIVEGRYLEYRYQWKTTIGDPADRTLHHQPLERRVPAQAGAGLLPVVRARLLRVLPARRGHRRRTAADPELRDGVPVQLRRARADGQARSVHPGRARSRRVRQRASHIDMGQAPRGSRAPRTVRDETPRRRQRAVGAGLSAALRGVPEGAQGEIPRIRSSSRAPIRSPIGQRRRSNRRRCAR